jgi:hypothetical protein
MPFVYRPQEEAKDEIIQALVDFLSKPDTAASFDSFFDEHCASFADRKDDTQEQKLEWTHIHSQYQDMVDDKLGGFMQQYGLSATEVLERCRTSDITSQGGRYIFMFVASTDYAYFASSMKSRHDGMYGNDAKAEAKVAAMTWLLPTWATVANEDAKAESKGDAATETSAK